MPEKPVSKEALEDTEEEGKKNYFPLQMGQARDVCSACWGSPLRRAGRAQSSTGSPGQNPHLGQTHHGTERFTWDNSRTGHSLVRVLGALTSARSLDTGLPNQPRHIAPVFTHFLEDGSSRFGMAHLASTIPPPHWYPGLGSELGEGAFPWKGGETGQEEDEARNGAESPWSCHHEGRASLLGPALEAGWWDAPSDCWGGAGSS